MAGQGYNSTRASERCDGGGAYRIASGERLHVFLLCSTSSKTCSGKQKGYEVRGFDVHEHMRGQRDWRNMTDHLLDGVHKWNDTSSGPLIGLGHSFGGAMLCCAAGRRPDLFQRLVIVDPPMFRPLVRITWKTVQNILGHRASFLHPLVQQSSFAIPSTTILCDNVSS
eukprot:761660-Hanusia_phi.AAC.3